MTIFCTLFDSNYLDKGLVMFDSLYNHMSDFKLYTLAMDDTCYKILTDIKAKFDSYANLIPISINNFIADSLNSGLAELKQTRDWGEFCWTCTPYIIDYVITRFNEKICTYIDSDLYFYANPECLIDDMQDKSVQIVEHRLTNSISDRALKRHSGTYCVQFNTFKNTPEAMNLLRWWKSKCFESASRINTSKVFGDQKYLEGWETKSFVSVLKNLGGGVAPWNINQYRLINDGVISKLEEKKTGKIFELIFYHYHSIKYITPKKIDIFIYARNFGVDDKLVSALYIPYLEVLDAKKNFLRENYGFYQIICSTSGSSKKNFIDKLKKVTPIKIYLKIRSTLLKIYAHKDIITLPDS